MLEVQSLRVHYGTVEAVKGVSFHVNAGEMISLIGANGAGKSTILRSLTGLVQPSAGDILFENRSLLHLSPHQIVARGLGRTFQLTTLFQDMTVLENIRLGLHLSSRRGLGQALWHRHAFPRDEIARAQEVLEFTDLAPQAHQLAKNLPHGHQRTLGIAMALAARPRLLMLDEPVTGMNFEESQRIMQLVHTIRDRGTTILLVEHNMKAVMSTCERIVVLSFGQKLVEGTPAEVSTNRDVITAYLGTGKGGR